MFITFPKELQLRQSTPSEGYLQGRGNSSMGIFTVDKLAALLEPVVVRPC